MRRASALAAAKAAAAKAQAGETGAPAVKPKRKKEQVASKDCVLAMQLKMHGCAQDPALKVSPEAKLLRSDTSSTSASGDDLVARQLLERLDAVAEEGHLRLRFIKCIYSAYRC